MQNVVEKFGANWTPGNEGDVIFEEYDSELDLLGVVFHHPLNVFRACIFRKDEWNSQWIGLWWSPLEPGTICRSESEGISIVRANFENRKCSD